LKIVLKFTKGQDNFDKLLGSQRMSFNKEGIGCNPLNEKKTCQNFIIQETSKNKSHTTCNYCFKSHHISYSGPLIKTNNKIIQIWVPKGTRPYNMVKNNVAPKLNVMVRKVWSIVLLVRLKARDKLWYLDSGCSRHKCITEALFIEIKKKKNRSVTVGDNKVGKFLGIGKIGNDPSSSLENVYLVDGWIKV